MMRTGSKDVCGTKYAVCVLVWGAIVFDWTSTQSSPPSLRALASEVISQREVQSLLAMKREFGNPVTLSSWNDSGVGACVSWVGIKCAGGKVISLSLPGRGLSGPLAEDVGNLTSLRKISLHHNAIIGPLPQSLGRLSSMRGIALFMNQFSGIIPSNLGNSSALQALDISFNLFSGEIPAGLAQSPRIFFVDFSYNGLWGGFPLDWTTSQSLLWIGLAGNYLSGTLPDLWGRVDNTSPPVVTFFPVQLQHIDLRDNSFSGSIPPAFGALGNLSALLLGDNKLMGGIPAQLGELSNLRSLDLSGNAVSGAIPSNLGNLHVLNFLDLASNSLVGPIPAGLNTTNLSVLLLGDNELSGSIPEDFGNLIYLTSLNFSSNRLTGSIPASLASLTNLKVLALGNNDLTGSIPTQLGSLSALSYLDLSINNISGSLPLSLINLTNLTSFNVSYNNLSGRIPPFIHAYSNSAFLGNPGLCGRPPFLSCAQVLSPAPAPGENSQSIRLSGRRHLLLSTVTVICIALGSAVGALAVLCLCLLMLWKRKGEKDHRSLPSLAAVGSGNIRFEKNGDGALDSEELGGKLVHFDGPMAFSADHLLCATAEVLGKSSYGTVYKATLEDGNIIAVKRLREGIVKGQKEFESEVGTIGKIRHPNLLALRAYYWGPKDEKLLVFDYMSCGSLAAFLHARGPETPLNWETRMKIALGTARGLEYLHQNQNIIHGNLTASNILLDGRMNARISDYGLACLMTPQAMQGLLTTAGTLGYRAPELLKAKKATSKSDVYSFGIMLLELLTGKAPVEHSSSDSGMDLAEWVSSVVKEEWTSEVFDVEIINGAAHHHEGEMMNALQLAMVCVNNIPTSRPEMEDVLRQLEEIRPDLRFSPESSKFGSQSKKE